MGGLRLEGSTVLLTGATGGIGRAIAHALHERGASLVLTGRKPQVLDSLRAELGDRAEIEAADLADRSDVERLSQRAAQVDVLVANAALPASGTIEGFTPEEIDRALDVNLRAPVQLARAGVPAMVSRGRGHLVFVSSLSGKVASAGSALYSATKFGLRGFAAGLREDLHGSGVGVTTVFPGFVSGAGLFADAEVELPRGVGTRTPEQVADAVISGIERDRAEIDVAPLSLRAGALFSAVAPTLAARMQRRLGSRDLADAFARGQADKR
jgi:short-subunit dehydrogenase